MTHFIATVVLTLCLAHVIASRGVIFRCAPAAVCVCCRVLCRRQDQLVPVGVVCVGREPAPSRVSMSAAASSALADRSAEVGDPVQLTGLDRKDMNGRTGVVIKVGEGGGGKGGVMS